MATRPGVDRGHLLPGHLGHPAGQVADRGALRGATGPEHRDHPRLHLGPADRRRRLELGGGHGQDPGGHGQDLGRCAVAHGELHRADRAPTGQMVGDVRPRGRGPRRGGLGDVADHGHRARQRTAGQHPQLHGREVLDLVHHDVTVLAQPVLGAPRPGPEQGPGLVDQRGIGRGPGDLLERRRPGPVQQELLLVRQDAPRGGGDERRGAEQVVEELVGGEPRPHAVEGFGQLGHPLHLAGEVLQVELVVGQLGGVLVAGEGRDRGRGTDAQASAGSGGPGRPAAGPPTARPSVDGRCGSRGGAGPSPRSAGCPLGSGAAGGRRRGRPRRRPAPAAGSAPLWPPPWPCGRPPSAGPRRPGRSPGSGSRAPGPTRWTGSRRSPPTRAAPARCSGGTAGWAPPPGPPGARGGTGGCRGGRRPGGGPPPSCRCPGRPGPPARRAAGPG